MTFPDVVGALVLLGPFPALWNHRSIICSCWKHIPAAVPHVPLKSFSRIYPGDGDKGLQMPETEVQDGCHTRDADGARSSLRAGPSGGMLFAFVKSYGRNGDAQSTSSELQVVFGADVVPLRPGKTREFVPRKSFQSQPLLIVMSLFCFCSALVPSLTNSSPKI
jgi:hypothetical protein